MQTFAYICTELQISLDRLLSAVILANMTAKRTPEEVRHGLKTFTERAFLEDREHLRARGYASSKQNRALADQNREKGLKDIQYLPREEKRDLTRVARRKRAKAVYQAYVRAVLDGTPLSVVAERFGLTEMGVNRIVRERACWIDVKTAAEVEAALLVQVNQLVQRADDLSASLDNELNLIEKRKMSGKNGDYYEIEQTLGAGKDGVAISRRLPFHRARKMLLKERMGVTVDVLSGIRKLLPDNVLKVHIGDVFQQMDDKPLMDRIQKLRDQREVLISGLEVK